jgi:transglutaminase-like putative cysteine protease
VTLWRPVPRPIARAISAVVLLAWIITLAIIVVRAYTDSSNLAADLAQYGTSAEWRGVYYRGEKIGFTVSQTVPASDGFDVREDGRLQMSLLGATSAATIQTRAHVDRNFALRSFAFSLDPGTGPVQITGQVSGRHISLVIHTPSGTQTEERDLPEPPVLSVNVPRRLASEGLKAGTRKQWMLFDPATLRQEPAILEVVKREVVNVYAPSTVTVGRRKIATTTRRPVPAFRVETTFAGLRTTSWITDTGETVREESPLGLMSVRESPETARRMAIGRGMQSDLLEAAAVVPSMPRRIDNPRDVRRLRMRIDGADLTSADLQGAGQSVAGSTLEIRDARTLTTAAGDGDLTRYLAPEPLIESDDPAIRAEAEAAIAGATDPRTKAERLTRRVNVLIDKKPTVSLPSAREVLRTRVGDCNEHTALYVAMARAVGIPSRIAVGLVFSHGAFYYHAWPEVYIEETRGRGLWLPVDPTFNEFPADATHVRLARGGLDRQAAILPLIGKIRIAITDLELAPNSTPILVGRRPTDLAAPAIAVPQRSSSGCWSSPSRPR